MSSSLPAVLPRQLVARGVAKSYAGRPVLDGLELSAHPGRPLALVGENGAGKSTLLRILAGLEPPDSGTVERPADVGYLPQHPEQAPGRTVGDVLHDALAPLHDAVARLERLAARLPDRADEYASALAYAEAHDAWDADRRATLAASRLGLDRISPERPVSSLSGGERSRLALAALLTRQPECLLLDEPTNHLDGPALAFLEETVRALPGVVVFASHDRTFLDAVAHTVVDLDPAAPGADGRGGTRSSAGYTAYVSTKRAARQRWEERYDSQQTDLADLRRTAATTARRVAPGRAARDNDKSLHNFKGEKVQGTVSRRVRDAERRIEVLQRELLPRPPAPLRFDAPLTRTDGVQVVVRDLEVPGRLHLPALDVPVGARLLVTGRNGSGKSTLLGVLAGRVRPARGQVGVGARRTGFLPQDVVFPHPGRTAREICPDAGRLGLLHPRDLDRPVTVLSEGQRRRLALATLVARQPDLLLLDEPTNHISLALAEELEEALGRSAGTVLVATHDRWLRRRWEGETVRLGA